MLQAGQPIGPGRVVFQAGSLFKHQPPKLIDAQLGHQKLDPGLVAVFLFAVAGKNAGNRLRQRQQFFFRHKIGQQFGLMRHRAQPAANNHFKAFSLHPVDDSGDGDQTQIVHVGQAAGVLLAAGEGRFEFAAKVLHVAVAQKILGKLVGVAGHVERFVAADAGQRAGGHIAHRVAAGFAGSNAHRRQPAVHIRRVFQRHKMKLKILAGGHVQNIVGVLLGHIGQYVHLGGGQPAVGNFEALHAGRVPKRIRPFGQLRVGKLNFARFHAIVAAAVVVALAVRAAPQPQLGKDLFVEFALPAQFHLGFKLINFLGQPGVGAVNQQIAPG